MFNGPVIAFLRRLGDAEHAIGRRPRAPSSEIGEDRECIQLPERGPIDPSTPDGAQQLREYLPALRTRSDEDAQLRELKRQLEQCEYELTEAELELATLQSQCALFERRYRAIVGVLYLKLDQLKAKIQESFAKLHPYDEVAQEAATEAHERAQRTKSDLGDVPPADAAPAEFRPSAELKALFRQVALKVHPDRAVTDQDRDRRTHLMAEANLAYSAGDMERLRAVMAASEELDEMPEDLRPDCIIEKLIRDLETVNRRISTVQNELSALRASDLAQLFEKVAAAEADGKDLLSEMAGSLSAQISALQKELEALRGVEDAS